MTTAWILPGGASFGAVQVGVAEALLAAGQRPDLLVGASIGGLNAAWLAADPSPRQADRLRRIWLTARRSDVLPLRPLTLLAGLTRASHHLVDNDRLSRWLRGIMPYDLIEDAEVPLTITASDLVAGEPAYLERGDVVTALLASSAIPGLLPPVRLGGRWLVDGWFMGTAPLGWVAGKGIDTVYVLPCGGVEPYQRTAGRSPLRLLDDDPAARVRTLAQRGLPRGAAAINQALVGALVARSVREEFVTWTPRLTVYLPPAPSVAGLSTLSLGEARGLMDAARRLTTAWLPDARPLTPEQAAAPSGLVGVND
jgi:NTE family protein